MDDTDLHYNHLQNGREWTGNRWYRVEVGRESVWEKEQELFEVW